MKTNKKIVKALNDLLASYQIHYQNLRGLHWNVKGKEFFEIHAKYEELYTRVQEMIDDLAERILTLDAQPMHKYQDYLSHSLIAENKTIHDTVEGMTYVVMAQNVILKLEYKLLKITGEVEDEGTNSLISEYIGEKEKTNWMFKAWID